MPMGVCEKWGVAMRTASTARAAIISSGVAKKGISGKLVEAEGVTSETAARVKPGTLFSKILRAWLRPMLPRPMTPIRTVFMRSK